MLAVVIAAFYAFAVLPALDGFPLLAFALGVFYVPARAFQAIPSLLGVMLPTTLIVLTQLSLGETYAADPQRFAENGLGTLVGLAFALEVTRLLRSPLVALRIRRLVAADRRDLARLATGHENDLQAVVDDMLDRFEALSARLGGAEAPSDQIAELAGLRGAVNVVRLRECLPALAAPLRPPVHDVLTTLAALGPDGEVVPADLLPRLDHALRVTAAEPVAAARSAALALSGLRMALLPAAPPPELSAVTAAARVQEDAA